MISTQPIRVLIVDDSALARKIIAASLAPYRDIEIVGTAMDPYIARAKILELNPDVITLDIEMPRMDGLTFLKLMMRHKPQRVIIMSSLTTAGSRVAIEALNAGAVDVVGKPNGSFSANSNGAQLAEKIRTAARARIRPNGALEKSDTPKPPLVPRRAGILSPSGGRNLILLGASTGGTEALKVVLTAMRGDLPCICVVQHIPAYFSKAFAERLNQICEMEVREAVDRDETRTGLALIAPGGYHMMLQWEAGRYVVRLTQGPPVHHQRPAVDILFDSAVRAGAGPYSAAAVLTGMGSDGALGLLHLRQAGAVTVAQDEESCVVYGMPREAAVLGGAQHILSLPQIGLRLQEISVALAARARGAAAQAL